MNREGDATKYISIRELHARLTAAADEHSANVGSTEIYVNDLKDCLWYALCEMDPDQLRSFLEKVLRDFAEIPEFECLEAML